MRERIKRQDENFIDVVVNDACPLNWLAEYYDKYKGKVIEIDDTFWDFIKDNSDKSRLSRIKEGMILDAKWRAGVGSDGKPFPSTDVKVEKYWTGSERSRNFITRVKADDIPEFGFVAEPGNSQIVYLKAAIQKKSEQDNLTRQ